MSSAKRIALVGSPNSGKTTIFNALTGMRRKVANYAGATVDHYSGALLKSEHDITLIDLPGTYSMEPLSEDEAVAVRLLSGKEPGQDAPDAIVIVADATTLERTLPFIAETLALRRPTAIVLTMIDELKARGGRADAMALRRRLGVPVIGVVGNKGIGLDDLRHLLEHVETWTPAKTLPGLGDDAAATEARHAWAHEVYATALKPPSRGTERSDRIDAVLLHPVWGLAIFALTMLLFFQLIFVVAAPFQGLFEEAVAAFGRLMATVMPDGWMQDLVVDGIIAGVGAVVVFVPQIALLLLMIAVLEASGYMARAAFIIDRVMGWAGLEGRSFIALLSSYACAVPGIMAARTVPDPRARLSTILVAPFMTCSARLPVYALLIAAFIPAKRVFGVLQLQGLVLFGLYVLGAVSALLAAAVFKRGLMRGKTWPFYMELPPYRRPTLRAVVSRVRMGIMSFLRKAGTIIMAAAIVLWVLLTYPQVEPPAGMFDHLSDVEQANAEASWQLEHTAAASIGHAIEPAIAPLGYDWKIGIGLVASLAAREVIVSTLGQIYAVADAEEDMEGLAERMRAETRPDGSPVYTIATALSLLVFFVYSLQCVSTIAAIKRETNSWRWPAFAFTYMFLIAWIGAFATYQIASRLLV